ncbi:MAG TPA: lipoprotein-releasing ABC transporter permease subunit [Rhizomicrobium sp.]
MAAATRPFAPFEWMVALRYLRPKRREAFVSVISIISLVGIALGVAALIIVMAVMNGFRHELLSRILGLNGHMAVEAPAGNLVDFDAVAARVRGVPGVMRVAPIITGQVMGTAGGVSLGVLVRGMRAQDLKSLSEVSRTLSDGALERYHGGDAVIVGGRLANQLRIHPGDKITLIAPRGDVTPFGVTPRVKSYTVAGTFNVGIAEYDQTFVFMPLQEAQLYFNLDDKVSGLEIMVKDPDSVGSLIEPVSKAAGPYSRIVTWQDMNMSLFEAVEVERNVMFLILSLIILVAALNIISGLYMLVKDKGADIAVLRTMGATRGAVMRIFLIAGMSIGIAGTLTGWLLGVVISINIEPIRQFLSAVFGIVLFPPDIYHLTRLPEIIDTHEVTSVILMALTLSFLATLYPSWRAARLDPVEALRYE